MRYGRDAAWLDPTQSEDRMVDEAALTDAAEHVTHVERGGDNATYYWWCEENDCYATHRRYLTSMEALDAAEAHERNPG